MKTKDLREYFPGLNQKCYGKDLVYLDNAATSQRCRGAIELLEDLSYNHNANIHRSVYKLASEATSVYEQTRDYVREYINAARREEIIFTSGVTFSINMVAHTFGEVFIDEGDNVIVGESEHHSNIVPWQLLALRKKMNIKVLPVTKEGYLDVEKLPTLIDERTKLVCVAQISNVLGVVNSIEKIVEIAHEKGVKVLVDGAQGAVHLSVDVQKIDCDFYAFSGHKLFASTGTGILYAKKEILEEIPPFLGGGEMIGTVSFSGTTYADLPYKFEAGTPNFNTIPTLKPALELLGDVLEDGELQKEAESVKTYVYDKLVSDNRIVLSGCPKKIEDKIPLFSFWVKGVHHEDLALVMDKMGVALRSGHMCAEPLMSRIGSTGVVRASFAAYNTLQEAEYFIECLNRAIDILS